MIGLCPRADGAWAREKRIQLFIFLSIKKISSALVSPEKEMEDPSKGLGAGARQEKRLGQNPVLFCLMNPIICTSMPFTPLKYKGYNSPPHFLHENIGGVVGSKNQRCVDKLLL